ncbi:MAG: hypothetical protein OWV35_02645 [Firmicutes bacterium]|nr:hypothetical protein [Bacillota bacterium]
MATATKTPALETLQTLAQGLPLVTADDLAHALAPVAQRQLGARWILRLPDPGKERAVARREARVETLTPHGIVVRILPLMPPPEAGANVPGQEGVRLFVSWTDLWAGHVVVEDPAQPIAEALADLRRRARRVRVAG